LPTRALLTSWPPCPGRACVTLHRLFAERLGVSVMTFYRDLRLSKADELLQQSALSVLDIALLTGFTSAAHFARPFREKYGVSPRERRPDVSRAGWPGRRIECGIREFTHDRPIVFFVLRYDAMRRSDDG
jgi:AraC-like DNA-binding protein